MLLSMEGKNLLEFRDKFPNFRNSIKISMNFYNFNLVLARLKLIDKSGTRHIFILFLEPRTYYDLSNKIYFIIFRGQMNPVKFLEICNN
jgi:hypothetical protein